MSKKLSNLVYFSPNEIVIKRKSSKKQDSNSIEKIKKSIEKFGFLVPLLISKDHELICGFGRLQAAKEMGLKQIPVIYANNLSPEQIRAFRIADNKITETSQWDIEILSSEIKFLSDCEFELDVIGFEVGEIDVFLSHGDQPSRGEVTPEVDITTIPVSQIGDVWLLGKHRLYCGSALDNRPYETLFSQDQASMVFTDPPYNVPISGHVCGNGKVQHREFEQASGEMTPKQFITFLSTFMANSVKQLIDGGLLYCCMDWRHTEELEKAANQSSLKKLNLCVWNKSNAGMGSFYRSKHELIFVYRSGKAQHRNNVMLGKNGRNRTNVWDYPSVNTFNNSDLEMHPTVKPIAMVEDAIKDCTKINDIVLDPFMGSGTTLLAAEKSRRIAYGIELDPLYVDLCIDRWEKETKKEAVHSQTGNTFQEIKAAQSVDQGGKNVRKR